MSRKEAKTQPPSANSKPSLKEQQKQVNPEADIDPKQLELIHVSGLAGSPSFPLFQKIIVFLDRDRTLRGHATFEQTRSFKFPDGKPGSFNSVWDPTFNVTDMLVVHCRQKDADPEQIMRFLEYRIDSLMKEGKIPTDKTLIGILPHPENKDRSINVVLADIPIIRPVAAYKPNETGGFYIILGTHIPYGEINPAPGPLSGPAAEEIQKAADSLRLSLKNQ